MKKITTCAALAAISIPGHALDLSWNSASPGGSWDTTAATWLNGATPSVWNNATPDSAIFGSTGAGTVALGAAITAGGITINSAGYSITGNILTLAGATPTIVTAADATISSVIAGSAGLTKAGSGQLDLTGANTYGGVTTVSGGTLKISTPQISAGPLQVNAGILALNGGSNSNGYRITRAPSITVQSGAEASMLVSFPWGWYGNNDATGITVNLSGGTFKMNNLHQGSFGVKATLSGGSIDGGGAASRWELGRSGGFDGGITSFASPVTSTVTAGIIMMRSDSGQLSYPFAVAQGTTPGGIDLDISSSIRGNATTTFNKTGSGTLRLAGVSTHTGPTLVSAGKLILGAAAAYPSTPITISSGAVLDVSERTDFTVISGKSLVAGRTGTPGTDVSGNLVLEAGGSISPAGNGAVGILTVAGNLALNGGNLGVDQAGGISDRIAPTGAVTLTGTNTFSAAAGYFPPGTYTLLTGASVSGAPANLAWGSGARGQTANFAVNPTDVQMTLSAGAPASLTWSGTASGVWDVNTTANWNAGAEKFFQLDAVTFPDAPANATVTLTGALAPASVAFTNATTAYLMRGGTGSISGTGSITKSNAGTVTLWNNANTFSGGTVINGGTINLNNGAALTSGSYSPLGSGLITVNPGGTLQVNPGNETGGNYTFANAINLAGGTLYQHDGINRFLGQVTVSAPSIITGRYSTKDVILDGGLAGSADLTVTDVAGPYGSGSVQLTADGTYSGKITISQGHLIVSSNNAISNAEVAVETTMASDFGSNLGLTLTGPATDVALAGLSGSSATAHVQNGDSTPRTLTVNSSEDRIFAGNFGSPTPGNTGPNALSIVKGGTGGLTLAGSNTYTGTTTVTGGELIVPSSNASLDYSVGDGAALGINLLPATPTMIVDDLALGGGGGASLDFLNFTGNTSAPAIDTLTAVTDGVVTIHVAGTFDTGSFPLIYSADGFGGDGIGAFVLGPLPRGVDAELDVTDPNTVVLVVNGTNSLVWKGNVSSAWDLNTTSNWSLDGVIEKFLDGDAVLFDDSAGANTNVVLDVAVSPASVSVNSSGNYAIGGTGSISGPGGLLKSGAGELELGTANSFAGDVQIMAGKLVLSSNTALGSTAGGTSIADGGTLDLNGSTVGAEALAISGSGAGGSGALVNDGGAAASFGGPVTLAAPATIGGSGDLTMASNVSGNSDLTKTGSGALNLSSPSTGFTGFLTVQDGAVNLLAANALPNSRITIEGPGILAVGADNALRNPLQDVTVKSGGLLTVTDGFTTNFGSLAGGNFLTLEGGGELGGSNPAAYWGSWTINTVDRKITVAGGPAQAALLSARSVTPNGEMLRLAVSDVTGDPATDLVVTGSFGSQFDVGFDVEIDGGGTVEFAAANAHTGVTRVVRGQLVLTTPTALVDGAALELGDDATLVLDFDGTETVGSLTVAGAALPPGKYGVGGTPNAAISGTGTLQVGPSNPYLAWTELHDLGGAGADVDSDGDGISNGIEFILGADPSGPGSDSNSLLPSATITETNLVFVFRCREDALAFADVEYDADLVAPWTVAVDGAAGVGIVLADGIHPNDPIDNQPVSQVTVTIPRAGSKLFARLTGSFPAGE